MLFLYTFVGKIITKVNNKHQNYLPIDTTSTSSKQLMV